MFAGLNEQSDQVQIGKADLLNISNFNLPSFGQAVLQSMTL